MPRLLTITFTTAVFWAEAAYGSLKPPPTRRLRRALLHLSYSTTISRLLDTTRSSNRAGRFPASGSRKRLTLLPTEGSRYGVRTSSRAGVSPAEVQRLFTAHCFTSYPFF